MIPARETRERPPIHIEEVRAARAAPERATLTLLATIAAADGRFVTGGEALLSITEAGWTATVTRLDRPGVVASMYFTEGLREVLLRLADGRRARARITATSFLASAERVCELAGLEPLRFSTPVYRRARLQ